MTQLQWPLDKIIEVANALQATGRTGASTSEQIAAAFVLNNQAYLPEGYSDMVQAWERLDDWQIYVKAIKANYMHLIRSE